MADVTPEDPTSSRRERKKRETRDALANAAMELFAERGYENVTVADIAERADLDPSTFFRHFRIKEAVIYAEAAEVAANIGGRLAARPPSEPVIEAIAAAMRVYFGETIMDPLLDRVRLEIIDSVPTVRALASQVRGEFVRSSSAAIADRLQVDPDDDPVPYLIAVLAVETANWARLREHVHGRSPTQSELIDAIIPALDQLTPLLAE